jgi:hypothetical protein
VPPRHLPEPVGTMHSLPPHPIRSDGIGPYVLGERFEVLYGIAPRLARLEPFDIRGVVRSHIIHAEEETVLIGGEPGGTANFIAVIDPNVARTESGFHVGSSREELEKSLGAPVAAIDRAIDPHVIIPATMRNARAVMDVDRVIAFAVTTDAWTERAGDDCPRPPNDGARLGVCFGPPYLIDVDGDEIAVRAPGSAVTDKPVATARVSGLVYAAALRNPTDNRDEVVAIARIDDASVRSWTLSSFQLDKGKLVKAFEPAPLYQLSAANARWIGAELHDVDLYIELASRNDGIEVGGLLTTRSREEIDKIRNIVPLSPVVVPHRHGKPTVVETGDAGVPDASEPTGDGPAPTGRLKP